MTEKPNIAGWRFRSPELRGMWLVAISDEQSATVAVHRAHPRIRFQPPQPVAAQELDTFRVPSGAICCVQDDEA